MNNLFRLIFCFVVCAFICGASTSVFAQDPAKIRELYSRMGKNQQSLKSLKSNIKKIDYNPQLKENTERQGNLAIIVTGKKNGNFRLEWTAPEQEIISVVDSNYQIYRPRLNTLYKGKKDDAIKNQQGVDNIFSFVTMTSAELKQKFDAKWQEPELIADNTVSAFKLKLTPKTAASYNYAEIWVTDDGMPVQAKIYQKNNDTSTILLYNVQKNAKVTKDSLKLKNVPKDVRIV